MTNHKATTRRFNFLGSKLFNSGIILELATGSASAAQPGINCIPRAEDVFLQMLVTTHKLSASTMNWAEKKNSPAF